MSFNFKNALLAGTAIVAVAGFVPAAQAADLTLTGAAIWGTAGNGMLATPASGDNVILGANTLTIDGSEAVVTTIGAITSTTTGAVVINNAADASVPITIGSIAITGAGNITQAVTDVTTRNVSSSITGNVSTGGALTMTNVEPDGAATNAMTIGGSLSTTAASFITAGNFAGASTTTLTVGGNSTFTGGMTVTGGANAAAVARLVLNGATNTGNITLTDGAAGEAHLDLLGLTVAQTVAGNIAGNGTVTVQNAAGVTFNGTVSGQNIGIENGGAALNSSATFRNTVTLSGTIALGGAGTGTNTVTFDGTTQAFTVTGTVTGAIAGETNNIAVIGGRTITQASAWGAGGNVDGLSITGTGTVLDSNAAITVTSATIGTGAKLDVGAGLFTGAIANSGTIQFTGAGGITGAITGTGALDFDNGAAINGAITQGSADIGAVMLSQTTASGYAVGSTNFSGGGGTLALAAGTQAVTGSFTNTTDGQGAITVADGAGTTTITGNVGASTAHSLASFQVLGATAQTVALTGNLFVDAIAINDADTLRFQGTSAQTVSGTVTDGIIVVGNGTTASDVTFNGVGSSLASGTVSANAVARFNANSTFAGAYTNTGTTYVGAGSTVTSDAFSDTGTYYLTVNDANGTLAASDFGSLTDSGANGTLTASRIRINNVTSGDVGVGTVQLLTGINLGAATLADNSIQYSFVTANNGANTDVTVARATNVSLSNSNNAGVAATLDGTTTNTNAQLVAIEDNLANASTQEQFNEILESVGPTVDGGAVVGGFNASVQSLDVANTRLASLRQGNETAMVAGEMGNGLSMWFQGFGQVADQDARDGVDGYEADTLGGAVGIDTANVLEGGTVGVSLSYANTDVDSNNANRTNSDVDSYQVSVYGDYDVAPNTYLAGSLAFAWNDIDQTRSNVGGITGLTASSEYDSDQYIAYAEVGHDIMVDEVTTFTPYALAHYQHISIDDYQETGAGGANLSVDSDNLDIFELGVGAEVAWMLDGGNGSTVRPSLNASYRHDLIGDNVQTTSTLAGGGAAFATEGLEPAHGTFSIGASLGYQLDNNWSFTADYDYEVKSDYDAHTGYVRAGYKF